MSDGDHSPGAVFSTKLYDYTVTAATKASIDTNVDGPNAGLLPTEFSLLEMFLLGRTDEAVSHSILDLILNADSGSNYDRAYIDMSSATVVGGGDNANAALQFSVAGSSLAAGIAGCWRIVIPAYADTSFNKQGELSGGITAQTTARNIDLFAFQYRSTSPVTRVKVAPDTAGKNFVTGTRLIVYGR